MKHLLENDPFFFNMRLYPKAELQSKIRMQKMLIDWVMEEYSLHDADHLDVAIIDNLMYDLHLTWIPGEEYEICALYRDAIKNCRDILIGVL